MVRTSPHFLIRSSGPDVRKDPYFFRELHYDLVELERFTIDGKLGMFSVFSVGLVTLDLGSDSFQADTYIEEGNIYWGYSTISMMFVPLLSVSVYVILSRRKELWKRNKDAWIDSLKTISRHIPFVQPFVHMYYLNKLMKAKAQVNRSLKFYKKFE